MTIPKKQAAIHTSDIHRANEFWVLLGGSIKSIRRTGENRYEHPAFAHPLRLNGRRKDTPAKLTSRINQVIRTHAANDESWDQ